MFGRLKIPARGLSTRDISSSLHSLCFPLAFGSEFGFGLNLGLGLDNKVGLGIIALCHRPGGEDFPTFVEPSLGGEGFSSP